MIAWRRIRRRVKTIADNANRNRAGLGQSRTPIRDIKRKKKKNVKRPRVYLCRIRDCYFQRNKYIRVAFAFGGSAGTSCYAGWLILRAIRPWKFNRGNEPPRGDNAARQQTICKQWPGLFTPAWPIHAAAEWPGNLFRGFFTTQSEQRFAVPTKVRNITVKVFRWNIACDL